MNAIAEARRLYEPRGLAIEADLANYLQYGYVFAEPGRLLLGRPCVSTRIKDWVAAEDADGWYVRLAVGKGAVKWFVERMPFYLPWLCWHRQFKDKGHLHVHSTDRLLRRISNSNKEN